MFNDFILMMKTVQFICLVLILNSIMIENSHLAKLSKRAVANSSVAANNITVTNSPVLAKCKDSKWVFHKSKCYRVFNTFEYFTSANKICQENGAKLASIGDPVENRVIEEIVKTDTRYNEAWIGLRIATPAKSYTWMDNAPYVYSNWLFERPNSEGNCAQIIPGGYWSNTLCYRQLQFVCKKAETTPVQKDNQTKVIIMITLPLSCIVIMLVFISYLCVRSHEEIKSLRVEEKKISQHFVDVVANSATVAPQNNGVEDGYRKRLKTREDVQNAKEETEEGDEEGPTKPGLSQKEGGRMYKQVTFV